MAKILNAAALDIPVREQQSKIDGITIGWRKSF